MSEEELKLRLSSLKRDIAFTNNLLDEKVKMIKEMEADLSTLHENYVKDFAPVKVVDYEVKYQCDSDMNSTFIDFSQGYNKFVSSMKRDVIQLNFVRITSCKILTEILILPSPYSELLFLRYYLNESPEIIEKYFFYSKSGFYRSLNNGIKILYDNLTRKKVISRVEELLLKDAGLSTDDLFSFDD